MFFISLLRSRHFAAARHKVTPCEGTHTQTHTLIYPHPCDHPLLPGWEREEFRQQEEEEGGFDRNGRLWWAWSRLCTHIDSFQLCWRTPGRTAVARCTRPHLTDVEGRSCWFESLQRLVRSCRWSVCVCVLTCLASVPRPAQRTGALVGS